MEVEKAFRRLLVKSPFYGLFCLSLPKRVTTEVDTLSVTQKGINCQLNINPDFWAQHTDDEQIALLIHELGHICLQHIFMSDSFADSKVFNIAADAEINSNITNLPSYVVTPQSLGKKLGISLDNNMGTKNYYEAIINQQQKAQAQNPQKPCNEGQGSPQSSSGSSQATKNQASQKTQEEEKTPSLSSPQEEQQPKKPQPYESNQEQPERPSEQYPDALDDFTPMDNHDTWKDFNKMPEANKQLISNTINSIVRNTAEQIEKMHGSIPGELSELINKLREKKPEIFNWKAYFRRLLGSIYDVNIRSTRRKESKRFEGSAGIQHRKKVSILVAVDTSASVSTKELQEFFSEIDYVHKAGAKVTLIQCDTQINSTTEYDGKTIPEIKGRGGTSFDPPVDFFKKHHKEYATLIYFTDGEAPLPKANPSGMVWVITSNGYHQDYPGKAIYIPKTANK
jgi:predicted metal-dependent peptidase